MEDEVELSELEERVVALCGGESFASGDAHLGIQPFPVRKFAGIVFHNSKQSTYAYHTFCRN